MQDELDFAVQFAHDAGQYMVRVQRLVATTHKPDKTPVTDADKEINKAFIAAVRARFGANTSVAGEEASALTRDMRVLWVVDPIDGTGEYIDLELAHSERTSCIGIALFKNGVLVLSVVYNPFRDEMFVASLEYKRPSLNGEVFDLRSKVRDWGFKQHIPYDFCHWDGAKIDPRFLEQVLDTPPRNKYSAISQACDVARGDSYFAIFPGSSIHDIAPGALIVAQAGGVVSDTYGQPLKWDDLSRGAVYAANAHIHTGVIHYLSAKR